MLYKISLCPLAAQLYGLCRQSHTFIWPVCYLVLIFHRVLCIICKISNNFIRYRCLLMLHFYACQPGCSCQYLYICYIYLSIYKHISCLYENDKFQVHLHYKTKSRIFVFYCTCIFNLSFSYEFCSLSLHPNFYTGVYIFMHYGHSKLEKNFERLKICFLIGFYVSTQYVNTIDQ